MAATELGPEGIRLEERLGQSMETMEQQQNAEANDLVSRTSWKDEVVDIDKQETGEVRDSFTQSMSAEYIPSTKLTREELEEEEQLELIYGAKHVIMLFVPITLCMSFVVITMSSVNFYSTDDKQYLLYTPFHPDVNDTSGQTFVKSLLNSLIVIGLIAVMTVGIVVLFKYNCNMILHGWIMLSTLMLMFMFTTLYLHHLFREYAIPVDYFSTAFCVWNLGVAGMLAIHWKAPLVIQQCYLIMNAGLMALILIKYLPEWTLWLILAVIACWDLVAVLHPWGPLRLLVEMAQERNQTLMPALIYSSTMVYSIVGGVNKEKRNKDKKNKGEQESKKKKSVATEETEVPDQPQLIEADQAIEDGGHQRTSSAEIEELMRAQLQEEAHHINLGRYGLRRSQETTHERRIAELEDAILEEEKGVKLGLGDFVFYSVLVGKSSSTGDLVTTLASFIGILMGLFLTLVLLITAKKALPALPISIAFGLILNFGTYYVISPLMTDLAAGQIFV